MVDHDLAEVVLAWPELPTAIRAIILAVVRAGERNLKNFEFTAQAVARVWREGAIMRHLQMVQAVSWSVLVGIAASLLSSTVVAGEPGKRNATFRFLLNDGRAILTDADIVEYFWPNHTLVLKPGVVDKLPNELRRNLVLGVQFKVEANGVVCYQGVFTAGISSFSFSSAVILVPSPIANRERADCELVINLGYPSRKKFKGNDPRGDSRIRESLAALGKLTGADMERRKIAALSVRRIDRNAKDGTVRLKAAMNNPDPLVREAAADAAASIGPDLLPVLLTAIYDEDKTVVSATETAFRKLGNRVLPALRKSLRDSQATTRYAAVHALRWSGPEAIADLRKAVGDEDPFMRLAAVESLEAIGPPARDAIPELQKVLHDRHPILHEPAARAIRAIDR